MKALFYRRLNDRDGAIERELLIELSIFTEILLFTTER